MVKDEYFQARTSTGEGGMFAAAGDLKIRPSKDATNFWGRVDTYLRLDDTEKLNRFITAQSYSSSSS